MRIAQIAPLTEPVPPHGHGSIEMIVHTLVEELVRRGHDVTLFAAGDSQTSARLRAYSRLSFRALGRPEVLLEFSHAAKAFREAAETCDLIHNHTEFFGLGLRDLVPVPALTTVHAPCDTPGARDLFAAFAGSPCVALTQAHRRTLPGELNVSAIIPHGLAIADWPFQTEKEGFLLFLGRIHPSKGVDLAIEAAARAGMPLVIAGPVDRYQQSYWDTLVRPAIDGLKVHYVGEVHGESKSALLKQASALLFPIQWEEPFGMVMIEALVCGTPVVALRRGSVPEVVRDGETGFIAETPAGLTFGLKHLRDIDPHRCRADVQERFSVGRMVDDYLAAYARLPRVHTPASGLPPLPDAGLTVLAGELATFFHMSQADARQRLELAPHLLAQAYFEAAPADESARQAWYDSEPMVAFERANRSLDVGIRQWLADAMAQGERIGARHWLSYRSDLGDLALTAPGQVDVAERPGPVLDFLRWRLRRRGWHGQELTDELPEASYDIIVAFGALEREADPIAAFARLIRALRPGGLVLIGEAPFAVFDHPWVPAAHGGWHHRLDPGALGIDRLASTWPLVFRRREPGGDMV